MVGGLVISSRVRRLLQRRISSPSLMQSSATGGPRRTTSLGMALAIAAALWLLAGVPGAVSPAIAANSTCGTVSGGIVNCTTVPTDGISYTNDPTTVNITNGTSGT